MTADPAQLAHSAAVGGMAAALATPEQTDEAFRLANAVLEYASAEEHLRSAGINPSPADVAAWMSLNSLKKRSAQSRYAVLKLAGALHPSGKPS